MAVSEQDIGRAYRLGYGHKPLPDEYASDSMARSAHAQGEDDKDAGRPEDERMAHLGKPKPDEQAPQSTPVGNGGKRSSAKSAPAPNSKSSGRARRTGQFATVGQRSRDLFTRPATLGGDGGGLLLAVFGYPIVLAILQHGPDGATAWLKAKFLNIDTHDRTGKPGKFYHRGNPGGGGQKPRHV